MSERKEGWGFTSDSKKWHYFVWEDDKTLRSLCRKFGYFSFHQDQLEQGNDDSSDNCTACKKRLAVLKQKQAKLSTPKEEK